MSFHFAVRREKNPCIFIKNKVYFVNNKDMLRYEDGEIFSSTGGFGHIKRFWREYMPVEVITNDKIQLL